MEDNKNVSKDSVHESETSKTEIKSYNIDPVADLTSKMIQTLEHINNFIKKLEEEERQEEGNNESSTQGFLMGPEYEPGDAIQHQLMEQVMLGADLVNKLLSRERSWDVLTPDDTCKESGEAGAKVSEQVGNAAGGELRSELSSGSHQILSENISTEFVEKEDGPSEKQQTADKSMATSKLGAGKSRMTESLEKLQLHVNNTLKLQQVNHEISLLLNRIVLCLNKRAMKKLQQETSSRQATNEEPTQPDPFLSATAAATSEASVSEPSEVGRGDVMDEKHIPENEEEDEDEGVEKGDTEKSEGEVEDFSSADGGESFTPTTEEDVSSQASSVGDESPVHVHNVSAASIFTEHLHTDGIDIHFQQLPSKSHHHHQRYSLKGTLLGITVEGSGPNKRVAKRNVTNYLLEEIIKKQKDNSLPLEFTPFTNQELQDMAPLLCKQQENYVYQLQQQCLKLKVAHPHFTMVSKPDLNNIAGFTVQCLALSLTAIGTGESKQAARRMAAKEILQLYENQNKEG